MPRPFRKLTGRVVDQANLLDPGQEAALAAKLAAVEQRSGRQFVVATLASLEGRTIEDYGYRLGRTWAIGDEAKDDGVLLIVAPNEKKVRIETGYGARVFLTDAVSGFIIRNSITAAGSRPATIPAGSPPGPTKSSRCSNCRPPRRRGGPRRLARPRPSAGAGAASIRSRSSSW